MTVVQSVASTPVAAGAHTVHSSTVASNETIEYVESAAAPAIVHSVASSPIASGGNTEYAESLPPQATSSPSDRIRLLEARQLAARLAAEQAAREREAAAAELELLEARALLEQGSEVPSWIPAASDETKQLNTAPH